jgi:hypothetical protein
MVKNKTVDQRLNGILEENQNGCSDIKNWYWHGCPGPYSDNANVPFDLDMKIMLEINRATLEECTVSESDYVRQCKSWMARKSELIKLNF